MPRHYRRKTDNGLIPEDVLRAAVARVLDGESAKAVSKDTGVPRTTLRRKTALMRENNDANIGTDYSKAQIFSCAEEKELADYLQKCSKMFYGLTTRAAKELAYEMAVVNGKKVPASWEACKQAGKEWLIGFLRRHPQLSIRQPEATSLARATSFNKHNINQFFDLLEEKYKSLNVEGRQIFNLDETGFTTVQKMPKVIASKGVKQVGQMTSRERGELVTVCGIVSATGVALPPVFIFPRKKFQQHMMNNAPEGSLGLVTDNGWMTSENFLSVIEHFVKHVQPSEKNPVVLVLDNHESHLSLQALTYAKENHVHIITLVPHTSNKTQPLDRTVYGPVKAFFNDRATSWMVSNPGKTITIYNIAELVNYAWTRGATPANITAGFKASGIWPLDRHIFPDYSFAPSDVTNRPVPAETLPSSSQQGVSTAPNHPPPTTDQAPHPPQPSTYGVSTTSSGAAPTSTPTTPTEKTCDPVKETTPPSFVSPSQFRGFPKAPPRTDSKRGRKRGKCVIATSSEYLEELTEKFRSKVEKSRNKKRKVTTKPASQTVPIEEDDSDDMDIDTLVDDESDDYESDSNEDEDREPILGSVDSVSSGDFVLCQYEGKKSAVLYVGEVIKDMDTEGRIEIDFMRRSGKVQGKFIKPQVEDIDRVPLSIIKAKLTRTKLSGTTERTKNTFFFQESLDKLNIC